MALRDTFDEAPELYDRVRPDYPEAVFEDLTTLAGLRPGSRVLELGCGTGQATVPLATRGFEVVAIELGAGLADVARRNLAAFPRVDIVNAAFEEWPLPPVSFDAAVAATSFHWLDAEVRLAKVADALRSGGALVVIATHHVAGGDGPFFAEVQCCVLSYSGHRALASDARDGLLALHRRAHRHAVRWAHRQALHDGVDGRLSPPARVTLGGGELGLGQARLERWAQDEERAQGQRVDRRGAEALQRVAWIVDHGPPCGVERGVDHHGHAGAALEGAEHGRHERLAQGADGLDARGAVDMHNGGDTLAPAVANPVREEHVGAGEGAVEELRRALLEHHRRHRAELLAALDVVEALDVGGAARIGEQRAAPERARPVLAGALEPRDDAVAGQHLGHRLGEVTGTLIGDARGAQRGLELVVVPRAPDIGAGHRFDAIAEVARQAQSGAQRGPAVARRRLHPHGIEGPFAPQARVGHAVERHAAGHGQRRLARLLVQPARQGEEHLLEARLHRAGEVGVRTRPVRAGAQRRGEGLPRGGLDGEAAVARRPDQLAQGVQEARGSVGGHGHDLVLVRRAPEPQVLGELLVEQPEGVGQALRGQHLERAVGARVAGEVRGALPAAVDDEHRAGREGSGQMRARGMRDVMGDEVHLVGLEAERGQEARRALDVERAQALPLVGRDVAWRRRQRGIVGVADGVDVVGPQAGVAQAPRDGLLGQLPGREGHAGLAVLAPAEALLLGGRDDATVDHDGGGGVVEDGVDAEDRGHAMASRTSCGCRVKRPGSGRSPLGSPRRPAHSTRWRERSGGGPQWAGGVGPKRTTDGVPSAVARCATPVSAHNTRAAPATRVASARRSPANTVAPASRATARARGCSPGPAVTTTGPGSSRATAAQRVAGQRRAGADAPGWITVAPACGEGSAGGARSRSAGSAGEAAPSRRPPPRAGSRSPPPPSARPPEGARPPRPAARRGAVLCGPRPCRLTATSAPWAMGGSAGGSARTPSTSCRA